MRAVVQRVRDAGVLVEGQSVAHTAAGLLVYLGVAADDGEDDARYLADKVRYLRCFHDEKSLMNLDVVQAGGAVVAVSAFTVQADARRGRRPSLDQAADGPTAEPLYELFCRFLADAGVEVQRGRFGAYMEVPSVNDGPICILLDSRRTF